MSTILAVEKAGRAAIAWDSMKSCGGTRSVGALGPPKVTRVGASWIGSAGLTAYYTLLEEYVASQAPDPVLDDERSILRFFVRFWRALREDYHFVNDQADADDPSPFADLGAEFLVANARGLFVVKEILSVTRFARFCAIGSGAPHAEGALSVLYELEAEPTKIARKATEVAMEFDAASGGPVEVREIP
jgi:ATP-dependent protease HslVU (ClpYQ) peptidase subunit